MAKIFGIWNKSGKQLNQYLLDKVKVALDFDDSDYSDFWINGSIAFGASLIHTTPQSLGERIPHWDESEGYCIVADARIDYREELIENLKMDWCDAKDLSDSLLILKAYQSLGAKCVNFLYGDFAFAIWTSKSNEIFCARDHLGFRPFYYISNEDIFAFSSSLKVFTQLDSLGFKIKESYVIESLILKEPACCDSPYPNIVKLEPANYLRINSNFKVSKTNYWDLRINPSVMDLNVEQSIEGMKKLIRSAVYERVRSAFPIGSELSGGLDSSCVTSLAASFLRIEDIPFKAFSQSLSQEQKLNYFPFKDESQYSLELASYAKISEHFFITGEGRGILESIERTLFRLFGPYNQDYSLLTDILYEKAREEGVRILLSGFGGDEGISSSGNGFYRDLIRSKHWKELIQQIHNESQGIKYIQLAKLFRLFLCFSYEPFRRIVDKLLYYSGIRTRRYMYLPLRRSLAKKYRTKKVFFESKVQRKGDTVRSRMYKKIVSEYITNRIENSYQNASEYNIEYRYPLLDVKLIEYYYSLPSHLKYRNGFGRYIFRLATEGVMPDSLRWRKDKSGYTVPNVHYRIKIDEEKCRDLIAESIERNKYHYVDYKKLNIVFSKLLNREKKSRIGFGNMIFLTSIGVLILQKWQREGKIDIGIKC